MGFTWTCDESKARQSKVQHPPLPRAPQTLHMQSLLQLEAETVARPYYAVACGGQASLRRLTYLIQIRVYRMPVARQVTTQVQANGDDYHRSIADAHHKVQVSTHRNNLNDPHCMTCSTIPNVPTPVSYTNGHRSRVFGIPSPTQQPAGSTRTPRNKTETRHH